MEAWRIQALINFHKAGLQEHRFAMSPAAVQLEEETIKALEELNTKPSVTEEELQQLKETAVKNMFALGETTEYHGYGDFLDLPTVQAFFQALQRHTIMRLWNERDAAVLESAKLAREVGQLEQKLNDVVERHTTGSHST